jgi:hypothetical protein
MSDEKNAEPVHALQQRSGRATREGNCGKGTCQRVVAEGLEHS